MTGPVMVSHDFGWLRLVGIGHRGSPRSTPGRKHIAREDSGLRSSGSHFGSLDVACKQGRRARGVAVVCRVHAIGEVAWEDMVAN